MGLKGFYPLLRKKGYQPSVVHSSAVPTTSTTTTIRRLDLLSRFGVIRAAYSQNAVDKAHMILEKDIQRFGSQENILIYVDGAQAAEKKDTAEIRVNARKKAVAQCEKSLTELKGRIDNINTKPRKRHFTDVKTSLANTFYWTLPMREAFAEYMKEAGWTVRLCETEADLAIAQECKPNDVVISADSDMLAYSTVTTLWRPVSKGLILVYDLEDVCRTLSLSRAQLTALAVVSGNDYGKNIYSLGAVTNYSIIKTIQGKETRDIVAEYLSSPQVESKNAAVKNVEEKTFDLALQVFVDLKQTPVTSGPPSVSSSAYSDLRERFLDLCAEYKLQKEARQAQQASAPAVPVVRLRSSRSTIRYKTVESPAVLKRVSGHIGSPPSQQLESTPQDSNALSSSLSQSPEGHPPLARTRTPKNRRRYSFKTRTGSKTPPPPSKMKQYVFKPYREPEGQNESETASDDPKPKPKPK
ncbi:hypothetical protein BGX26_004059, partial [Mortierella sp. AD094]